MICQYVYLTTLLGVHMHNFNRSKGIGGSDIPVILGLSPFKTIHQLYLEKIDEYKEEFEQSVKNRLKVGSILEPMIIDLFEETENTTVTRKQERLVHPTHDFLWGTIDGVSNNYVVEVKTIISINPKWKFGIPAYVLAQGIYYSHLANTDGFKIVAYERDKDILREIYTFPRDKEIEDDIINAAVNFWDNVKNRVEPTASSYSEVQLMFSTSEKGKKIIASNDDLNRIIELYKINKDIKELEKKRDELKLEVCKNMKDSTHLVDVNDNVLAIWDERKSSRVNIDILKKDFKDVYLKCKVESSSRNFSVKFVNK